MLITFLFVLDNKKLFSFSTSIAYSTMSAAVGMRGTHQHPAPPVLVRQVTQPSYDLEKTKTGPTSVSSNNCKDLTEKIAFLKQEAMERQKRANQSKCVQMSTDLVDFFGSMIMLPALRKNYEGPLKFADWHNELRSLIGLSYIEHLTVRRKQQIDKLMFLMEKLAVEMGISREHWHSLIFLNVTREPSREYFKKSYFSHNQLRDLKQLATKSLEKKLSDTVHILVDAVEKYIYNSNT